jgi:cytochrome c biogenesis protein CcmG/thiol:disulfide interchange protein DsbE
MKGVRWALWLPLAVFALFLGLVGFQLHHPAEREVQSAMIGKPIPQFTLPPANAEMPGLATVDLKDGKPKLLNIWASWCIPCAAEAPQLAKLKAQGVQIMGIAIRDKPEDVAAFLEQYGNPYARIGADNLSSVQLAIGSSGVPETFVVDGQGIIRYQHIGDIRKPDVAMLLGKLREAAQ